MVVQESGGNGLCVPLLLGYVVEIPDFEMVNTCSLSWLLVRLEGGCFWSFPSLKGERCDVWDFWGRTTPSHSVGRHLG
jgi:hypothetical protein